MGQHVVVLLTTAMYDRNFKRNFIQISQCLINSLLHKYWQAIKGFDKSGLCKVLSIDL